MTLYKVSKFNEVGGLYSQKKKTRKMVINRKKAIGKGV